MSYYYALVTLIDDYVGRLLAALSEHGLLDNTLVIYTSDHGEMLGDFAMSGKGNFYEGSIHVPLVISPPSGGRAREHHGLTEVTDIAATVLDYAGIERPPEMTASSLRPVIEGGEADRPSILSEFTTNDRRISGRCLRTERFKYVLWNCDQGGELYDIKEDPQERLNLYNDPVYAAERNRLAEQLHQRLMDAQRFHNRPASNIPYAHPTE